jgi:glycosyltransferase involved in cell wall biosynthesis
MLVVATVAVMVDSFLLPFARHYRRLGWEVDVLASGATESKGCREAFDAVWHTGWSRAPLDFSGNLGSIRYVQKLVDEKQYDLVHVHSPIASFVTRLALRKKRDRMKVVYTAHGFHFFSGAPSHKNLIFSRLEKVAGKWTDALVVMNREDEVAAKRHQIVDHSRLYYMPGIGIDLKQYSSSAVSDGEVIRVAQELGLAKGQSVFLKVAEMTPRKRHVDALRAFAAIPGPSVLLLAGDGPLRNELQRLASDLGIAERVFFLGRRPDVPVLMKLSNTVILVSSQEGLPRCVMEAMAMGKPVIGTDIRGTRDLLAKGSGLLVPVGDITAIAAAMKELAENPALGVAMGQQGIEAVKEYDLDNVIRLHDELYDEVLRDEFRKRADCSGTNFGPIAGKTWGG